MFYNLNLMIKFYEMIQQHFVITTPYFALIINKG